MSAARMYSEDLAKGDRAPALTHRLSRTDLVAYAGASLDFNPMHHDEVKATAAGQPSVFGHGMLSAGLLSSALTAWVGPAALRRFAVRFTSQVWPDQELTTEVTVEAVREGSEAGLFDLGCRLLAGDTVIISGSAVVSLPSRAGAAAPALAADAVDDSLAGAEAGELVGLRLAPARVVLERGPVTQFVRSVKDDDPAYSTPSAAADAGFSGIPIPPTFPFVMVNWGAFPEIQPAVEADALTLKSLFDKVRRDGDLVLHGGQEFSYLRPVLVGETVTSAAWVEDVTVKETDTTRMTVLIVRTDVTDDSGAIVGVQRATFLFRGRKG
jgi:acyl dehydratase